MSGSDHTEVEETGVIICGGGPTGTVLSSLLGEMQVPNIVLEKETDITTDPRGIALDEDGIRVLQSIGIYDRIYTEIGSCVSPSIPRLHLTNADFELSYDEVQLCDRKIA